MNSRMSVYALLPLVATMAYIPLLVMTISSRPWQRRHELFILFLASGIICGVIDFFLRGNFFPQYNLLLFKLLIIAYSWVIVQFYCFISSFFAPGQRRWLPLAYASLAAIVGLVLAHYLPKGVTTSGSKLFPEYGMGIIVLIVPLLILGARSIYLFRKRLKVLDNPVLYNQIVSLILSTFIAVIFTLATLLPWGGEFPIGHLGNFTVAFILSYAVIRRQLVDIRFVLRRALSWMILVAGGIGIYVLLFFLLHLWLGFELDFITLAAGLGVAALVGIVIYLARKIPREKIDQIFYRKTYDYRQKLLDFVGRIHNIFSFKELSGELLLLIVKATKCKRACLLFPEGQGGDFAPHFVEPQEEDNPLLSLRMRYDNPIVRYLDRKHRLLTIQSLDITPEFYDLGEQERKEIKAAEIELFVPVISRGNLVSILVLSMKQSGRYLLEDISLLEDIIDRVAMSIERGYLHEEVRQREEELSLINHLAGIMTSSLDVREIYDDFVKELNKVTDVDLAAIALVEGDELSLLAVTSEMGSAWQTGDRLPLQGTATEWVVTHKEPLIESDLTEKSRFWTGKNHLKQGIQSMVFLPLLVKDKAIGSLSLGSCRPNAYSQSQVQLLSQLASRIATPIENARLYAIAHEEDRAIKYIHIKKTVKRWVRVCLVQLNFAPLLVTAPGEFGYALREDDKKATEQKVFSALKIAQSKRTNIVCFPELSFAPEWVERIKTGFRNMVIVGGSYYRAKFNTCPVIIDGGTYLIRKINPSPDTEAETGVGRGMNRGKEIAMFQTRFGRFVVFICYDYRHEAYRVLHNRSEKLRNIDFIINPCYNKDVANFQGQANQDCQQANYPYILQVNAMVIRGKKCGGTSIIGMEHESGLDRYTDEGYRPKGESIKYKLLQAEGEMMLIADLDIKRRGVPVPASGPKMRDVYRYIYRDEDWQRYS